MRKPIMNEKGDEGSKTFYYIWLNPVKGEANSKTLYQNLSADSPMKSLPLGIESWGGSNPHD